MPLLKLLKESSKALTGGSRNALCCNKISLIVIFEKNESFPFFKHNSKIYSQPEYIELALYLAKLPNERFLAVSLIQVFIIRN